MTTIENNKIKEQLQTLKNNGISYKKVSELSGVNYSSIRNLMCGYRDGLSETNYIKIKKFLKKYEQVINEMMEVNE